MVVVPGIMAAGITIIITGTMVPGTVCPL